MPELVLYEIWCKVDFSTFYAIPANCDIVDVGLLLDARSDLENIRGIGEQLLAQKWGWV